MAFTPENPFLAPDHLARSLNRARVAALPPGVIETEWEGLDGFALLSAEALRSLIESALPDLFLKDDPFSALEAAFDDPAQAPAAAAVAHTYGRRLGCLLAVLKLGHPVNRAARPDWNDAHWAYWRSIRRVVLAGGLMAGGLGAVSVPIAAQTVTAAGANDLHLEHSPFPDRLPLLGLAASAPPGARRALVLDFGQTAVKRGLATLGATEVTALRLLPPVASPRVHLGNEAAAADRWRAMRDIITESWRETVRQDDSPMVVLGLAAHLHNGHPLATDRGWYGELGRLAPHLEAFAREDLSAVMGREVRLKLMHDGTAAAAAYAGSSRTAVLVLGTAIGVGYTDGLRVTRGLAASLDLQA